VSTTTSTPDEEKGTTFPVSAYETPPDEINSASAGNSTTRSGAESR
jgi:hypothetical protein